MERRIALTITAVALLVIGILIIIPGGRTVDPHPKVPWDITANPDGSSTVFTLTLGKSTLDDARRLFDDDGEITLFAAADDGYSVEAFFQMIFLSGLRADFVLTLEISQEEAAAMFDRGLRLAKLGSGEKKVTMTPKDITATGKAPIRHITYLPVADLEPDLLESRFGTPELRIPVQNGVVHWLYPREGLDIAVDPERKEVFQYVAPKDFARLVQEPLQAASTEPAPQ